VNDEMDLEIFAAFVEEGNEMMDDVEPQLVELEQSQDDAGNVDLEVVNSIFRLFHSMKGSAGFLELDNIVKLTHKAENLLDIFRKEEAQLEGPDVTLLLKTIDLLRKVMEDLAESGHDNAFVAEVDSQVAQLQVSITAKLDTAPSNAESSLEPELELEGDPGDSKKAPKSLPQIAITPEMHARYMEEADELLDLAEQNLLQALQDGADSQDLSEALRCLHSFKGNSGFMGYSHLEKLTHRTESVLECVVEGDVEADESALGVFLGVVDLTRRSVVDLANGAPYDEASFQALHEHLERLMPMDPIPETVEEKPEEPAKAEAPQPKKGFIPLSNMKADTAKPAAGKQAASPSQPAASKPAPAKTTASKAGGSIRVDLNKLDSLMNLVGELVIAEAMVTRNPDLLGHEFENLEKASHHLRRITSDLQDVAMSVRMVPLSGTFKKMVRLVHDTALKAGKKVNLDLTGEETEVDKTVIEQISDPLVHIVRNAIDHGLESAEERALTDKPESGTVTIGARHESGEVWITVSDDGKGLDRDVILAKAIQKGLVEGDGSELRDEDVYRLIFEPGFSTAAQVTEISGRGVGMDVVRKNIEKINGRVDIKSTLGKGSQFIMRIPLTMAIIEGMLVSVGRSTYNIPLLSIREAVRPLQDQVTKTPEGIEVVKLRDAMIPVIRVHQMYGIQPTYSELNEGILVIVENDGTTAALFVDEILGQQQTVVKGLSDYMGSPHGVSGCTILGDGRISLILDVATILADAPTTSMAMA
jgi:two-component system, chemotaxis family, sensor kinase CheA